MSDIFKGPGPRWYSIPAHRPFVDDLAQGLFDALSPLGPDALSQAQIFTPTRRGARTLSEAFLKVAGSSALLPPQIRPLGDLNEGEAPFEPGDLTLDLPTAISPLRRRFELTRLVLENQDLLDRDLEIGGAMEMAEALGGFLDSLQIEERDGSGLETLVTEDLAEHWARSRNFLEMALKKWPLRLKDLGLCDVSQRRVLLLSRLATQWTERPPQGVLVAAGSTGTAPATARLLAAIAQAPQGAVVLPGLDHGLADSAWADIADQHPQGALKRLLESVRIGRDQVAVWPSRDFPSATGRWRQRIINEALRPADATADWVQAIETLKLEGGKDEDLKGEGGDKRIDPFEAGLKGLYVVSTAHEDEAASVVALLMRDYLARETGTCALVTPDQALARRVTLKLARWGIVPDSSAGIPLAGSPPALLAALVARTMTDPVHPVTLLALLKHPMVSLGEAPERMAFERHGLRGARRHTWADLRLAIPWDPRGRKPAAEVALALDLCDRMEALLAPVRAVFAKGPATVEAATIALIQVMEALVRDPTGDSGTLWRGAEGEAMSRLLAGLIQDSDCLPPISARAYGDLLSRLVTEETLRTGNSTHSRLKILGAIEARLTRADRLILAGLEEGVWPQGAALDPFLSRPMREALGLPPPERRVGLAAHDFAQAACAPEVILLHTERRGGSPSVKSRWLWRLQTLAKGAGIETLPQSTEALAWSRTLDAPARFDPAPRPAPVPPVASRPRKLAVTRVETLTRDPYAVYARDILNLYPMDPPDQTVDARVRGTAIHSAFEDFTRAWPTDLPPDGAEIFTGLYLASLRQSGMPEDALARETALARQAAIWVMEMEAGRRADGRAIHVELKGQMDFETPAGTFIVEARADRIEIDPKGFGHIVDYKTGKAPSQKEVASGFSPQLTLTSAILSHGGFKDLGRPEPGDLTYIEVSGRTKAGDEVVRGYAEPGPKQAGSAELAKDALEGLTAMITQYDDPSTAYVSRRAPQFLKGRVGDYDHLARVYEWQTSGEGEDEE